MLVIGGGMTTYLPYDLVSIVGRVGNVYEISKLAKMPNRRSDISD